MTHPNLRPDHPPTVVQRPAVQDVSGRERRREPRVQVTGSCQLVLFDGVTEVCAGGLIQDISLSGVRVRTRFHALPGMKIQVFSRERQIALGEVRHCSRNEDGSYDIGVLIETSSTDRIAINDFQNP